MRMLGIGEGRGSVAGKVAYPLEIGLWTPKEVMKMLTTTMMKTSAVAMFSKMLSL